MNVKEGLSEGKELQGLEEERISVGEEDQSVLHIYILRQHNQTHQTLFELWR
jgi:hypothetical protein